MIQKYSSRDMVNVGNPNDEKDVTAGCSHLGLRGSLSSDVTKHFY